MVARGSALAPDELLEVLAGTEFGAAPLRLDNLGLDEDSAAAGVDSWRCETLDGLIRLVPPPILPLAKRFTVLQPLGMMPYPSYRWLFLEQMRARGYRKIAHWWPRQGPEHPAYEVLILEHEQRGQFLTTSCGLGRVAQRGGTEEDENEFLEFAVELPTHAPRIASALSVLALMVHLRDPGNDPIGRCHRAATHSISFPYEWVVYDSLPDLVVEGAHPIRLYQPLFMSADERASVPLGEIRDWIEENRTRALARWLEPVH